MPRSFLENTKVEFLLPQFPRGKNKSGQTICEPVLRGPYYVYARDLPKGDDVYDIDDYRQPGLLFGFKNGSPFDRTWAIKQNFPQQNHNTFTMLDNNSMAFCKPIIRCERIVDREAQTTKLRVEMYIVSQQIGEEFQTYKKKLTDLAEDVREQNRITNTLQSQIENSDVGGNVTPTLTRQYEQQLVVFRNTIAKYNAASDMPSFPAGDLRSKSVRNAATSCVYQRAKNVRRVDKLCHNVFKENRSHLDAFVVDGRLLPDYVRTRRVCVNCQ